MSIFPIAMFSFCAIAALLLWAARVRPAPPEDPGSDLDSAIHQVTRGLEPLARRYGVGIDLAVGPGLVPPEFPREILTRVIAASIQATPLGRVLITALGAGAETQIRVTDDGPGTNPAERLRHAGAPANTLAVEARPGLGTTVILKLTAGRADRAPTRIEAELVAC